MRGSACTTRTGSNRTIPSTTRSTPTGWVTGSGSTLIWVWRPAFPRSEEHTSELQSLMRISYAVFCLKKKKNTKKTTQKTDKLIQLTIINLTNYDVTE